MSHPVPSPAHTNRWDQVQVNWHQKLQESCKPPPTVKLNSPLKSASFIYCSLCLALVDKKEINQLYASFIKECPNGRMNRDDLLRIYRQFFPFGNAAPFVDRLIKILSIAAGGNGIEFAEYVTGLSVISRGRLDEKLFCKSERRGGDLL